MQRYFIDPGQIDGDAVVLQGEDARHLSAVMRARTGEQFIACDGSGRECLAEIVNIEGGRVEGRVVRTGASESEMAWRVTVAQSLPKGDKLETVIQKGTEAGAAAFLPFVSKRTVVQYDARKEAKRLDRWRKIAKEAAEQAHRGIVPEVGEVATWKELLAGFGRFDRVLLCYEEEGRKGAGLKPELEAFASRLPEGAEGSFRPSLLVVVGPEGGFDEDEARQAEAAGAVSVGLGRRILRTETAALVALAAIGYESGEMGEARHV
ncbi:RsmE family RNA methyltransferase [Cohnella hashimotonis]|uniref:Ribosomal RNA small subunit methyltransferase E n=1 Tax=Cohnella hashimotonis TaxID=2826895 RepID=A0ABT6TII1_9BACL|nr:RsmE family RNA methyltransferase [Cohnella hashimotonis]MDI4646637.1 RsmE family RNA methyltransferase [Cohnella hashimotonis]